MENGGIKYEDLITTEQAARFLRCSVIRMQQLRWKHKGPRYYRTRENYIRYTVKDLAGWRDDLVVVDPEKSNNPDKEC